MKIDNGRVVNAASSGVGWTFLTNHFHVLVCIAQNPDVRLRDVALRVGITERAVQRIVADLEGAGVLTHTRDGRRNRYAVHGNFRLRHPIEAHRTVNELLHMLLTDLSGTDPGNDAETRHS